MTASPLFSIKNCSFRYGDSEILTELTFDLYPGKFYGLIGPNGSGKSTLINLLMGTHLTNSGKIIFKNKPIESYNRRCLAQHLALVPQDISIGFDFSVYDIVLMGRHPHIPRFQQPSGGDLKSVAEAITLLDIEGIKDRPVTHLSGGEKQRVIVARALAQDTEVLMLDEATSSLDIEHTIQILRILRNRVEKTDKTIIAAVHDLNLAAAFCDELLVLKNKSLCHSGPIRSVLTNELLEEVFSVKGKVCYNDEHPRIEYQMLSS